MCIHSQVHQTKSVHRTHETPMRQLIRRPPTSGQIPKLSPRVREFTTGTLRGASGKIPHICIYEHICTYNAHMLTYAPHIQCTYGAHMRTYVHIYTHMHTCAHICAYIHTSASRKVYTAHTKPPCAGSSAGPRPWGRFRNSPHSYHICTHI